MQDIPHDLHIPKYLFLNASTQEDERGSDARGERERGEKEEVMRGEREKKRK